MDLEKGSGGMEAQLYDVLRRLVERDYIRELRELSDNSRAVVFYGCGAVFHFLVDSWRGHVQRRIDYCCDRDPTKWGTSIGGIPCISPEELVAMKDECVVFITICDFNPVFKFLRENGVQSVHLIYKWDIETAAFLKTSDKCQVAERLRTAHGLFADDRSRTVFLALLSRVLDRTADVELTGVCEPDEYFPAGLIQLSAHESLVDVGAFDGDTVEAFDRKSGSRFDRVFAFELDRTNYQRLESNVARMACRQRVATFNVGAWDSDETVSYGVNGYQSAVGTGDARGRVAPLDQLLKGERVTFIKMDVEGAELRALRGAAGIIRSQKPKLAVCVYHDFRHLWEVPFYVHSLVPEHRLFLRQHSNMAYETVCYAVP